MTCPAETTCPSAESRRTRIVGLAVALPCWGLLTVAWCLAPREGDGYGTASQLGLPDCAYLVNSGYPCPTCGMTTAVSAAAQGKLAAAFRAQPFGIVVAAGLLAGGLGGTWQLVTGRRLPKWMRPRWRWLFVAVGGQLVSWGWVWFSGVASGKWPIT